MPHEHMKSLHVSIFPLVTVNFDHIKDGVKNVFVENLSVKVVPTPPSPPLNSSIKKFTDYWSTLPFQFSD